MTAEIIPLRRPPATDWEPVLDKSGKPIANFTRHVPTGMIYYRKKFGKAGIPPLFKSTGETTIGRAKTKAQLMQQQHCNEHLGVDDSNALLKSKGKTFRQVATWVLENYTPTQRVGTQDNHKYYIGELIKHWGDLDVNTITRETLERLVIKLRRTKKRKTFFDYAKNANTVMSWGYQKKWCSHRISFQDPDQLYRKKIENKAQSHQDLTPEEKEILLLKKSRFIHASEIKALWGKMKEETRDQFVLSYECMMRLREGLYLTWDRCNVETGEITLRAQDVKTGSKTGKGRSFYMTPHAHERLKARWSQRDTGSPYVFPSPRSPMKPVRQNKTAWGRAKAEAKIKGKTRWHDLRHTALSIALLGDPALPPAEREASRQEPLLVSEYAGVSMRTIQAVYLKTDSAATKTVATAVKIPVFTQDLKSQGESGVNE